MRGALYLEFPSDQTVGYVSCIDAHGEHRRLGPARGLMRVPADASVYLALIEPQWLRALEPLPPDALYGVDLCKTRVEDEHLAHLARFTGLRELHLSKARRIGDEGVAHMARLTSLRWLDL